jgi:DHA1 family tetracycline resistance protein-like MFS transporter
MSSVDEVAPATPGRAAFAFVWITVALDMLALGIMIPVLPKLVIEMEKGDIARAASVTGVFGFVWAAMQFVFSPLMGALSDRFGRRPVILLSNLGLGADYVFMALAPSLAWLFVGRVISGITAASFPAASAYVADVTPKEQRAAKYGLLGAAFGLGFVVGPGLGGVLGQIDLRLPFWASAALSLVNAAYGFFILPESLPPERRAKVSWRLANPLGSLTLLRSSPVLLGLTGASLFNFLAHESLPSVYVLYSTYRYSWNERDVGLGLLFAGVCSMVVQGALMGPVVKRIGDRAALLFGLVCGVVGFGVFGGAVHGTVFLAGIPFIALWGFAEPALQSMMTHRIGPEEQGRLQGAIASARGITGMVGPLLFTQVLRGAIDAGGRMPGAPFVLAAGLVVLSFGWSLFLR